MSGLQSLGGYAFPWDPDRWTIPKAEKFWGKVQTYSSAAFFSFGISIVGKEVVLEWDWMSSAQFAALDALYQSDEPVVWNPPGASAFEVNILGCDGEYFEVLGTDIEYRKNVKITLMIMREIAGS